jgi:hypothetical protein
VTRLLLCNSGHYGSNVVTCRIGAEVTVGTHYCTITLGHFSATIYKEIVQQWSPRSFLEHIVAQE